MPWLWAIFGRVAASDRRRQSYRAGAPLPEGWPIGEPGPAEILESADTVERIRSAVDQLPSQYRDVLRLHLLHGLRAVDIADALERPVGTVYAQLHRGLEKLRTALPKELASLVFAAVGITSLDASLAAMRGVVVQAGTAMKIGSVVGGAAVSGWIGVWMMKKWIVGVAAVVVAWFGLDFALGFESGFDATMERTVELRSVEVGDAEATIDRVVSPEPLRDAGDAERLCTVLGRLVDEDGAPLAGRSIERWVGEAVDRLEWTGATVTTGSDGSFSMQFEKSEEKLVQLRSEAADHVPLSRYLYGLERGRTKDLGDLELPIGCALEIKILDFEDRPIAGVPIHLTRCFQARFDGELTDAEKTVEGWRGERWFESDALGVVQLPGRLRAGEYRLSTRFELAGPRQFHLERGSRTLLLRGLNYPGGTGTIEGRVVDQHGVGVSGVRVYWPRRGIIGFGLNAATTQADGAFRMARKSEHPAPELPLCVVGDGIEPKTIDPVAWGRRELVISVDRVPRLRLRLKGRDSGQLIRSARVEYGGTRTGLPNSRVAGALTAGPEGWIELSDTFRDVYTLRVMPGAESGYTPSDPIIASLTDQDQDVEVELDPATYRELLVLDQQGEPVPDALVQLGQPPADGVLRDGLIGVTMPFKAHYAIEWSRGRTDDQGRYRLAGRPGVDLRVLVLPREHLSSGWTPVSFETREPLIVSVDSGATVEFRIDLPDRLRELLSTRGRASLVSSLRLRASARTPGRRRRSASADLEFDEPVRVDGLEPGDYEVWLKCGGQLPLEPIHRLASGETRTVTIPNERLPSLVRIGVQTVGSESMWPDLEIWHVGADGTVSGKVEPSRLVDGHAEAWLLPGLHRCFPRVFHPDGHRLRIECEPLEIPPGQEVEIERTLELTSRDVLVVDAEGRPLVGERIHIVPSRLQRPDRSRWSRGRVAESDAEGRTQLFGASGNYHLLIESSDRVLRSAAPSTIDLAPGLGALRVVVSDAR